MLPLRFNNPRSTPPLGLVSSTCAFYVSQRDGDSRVASDSEREMFVAFITRSLARSLRNEARHVGGRFTLRRFGGRRHVRSARCTLVAIDPLHFESPETVSRNGQHVTQTEQPKNALSTTQNLPEGPKNAASAG